MSLYDETTAVNDYRAMLDDIRRNRDRVATTDPLADRPDIVVDHNGQYWTLAPVSRNRGMPLPVFYKFEYVPSAGTVPTDRPQSARRVKYPNVRLHDREPGRSKVKRERGR